MTRVAVLEAERCKTKNCGLLCHKFCPIVRSRIEAIRFEDNKAVIVESLCTGCGICIKKCPFGAISIVNLPDELEKDCSHRFGPNTFKLFKLPTPSKGLVLGLLGQNGIGKTTTIKILSGEVKPNLGDFEKPPEWETVVQHYRGSVLQEYFQRVWEGRLKVSHKPQYVDKIPQAISGTVGGLLEKIDERNMLDDIGGKLELKNLWQRSLEVLSGGELQRVAVAAALVRQADVYLFDEPSSYLDVKQRLQVARTIRTLKDEAKTIIIAEHDLAIIDYLSDQICLFYGEPGVYGVVSNVHGARTGINIYLQGYIPDSNVRFREEAIIFHEKPPTSKNVGTDTLLSWEEFEKTFEGFKLFARGGEVKKGEIVGILGPNGIGKTTFVKILGGIEKSDDGREFTKLKISYKPQYISAEYEGSVQMLLMSVAENFSSSLYRTEVLLPLKIDKLLERNISELSGGELQKVAIAVCLSREAELFLLDEPSAYLDVEERLNMAKAIRRIVESRNATAFVVEHDVVTQDFIADRLMVFSGEAGQKGIACPPLTLRRGMNTFLREMQVTFRRDPATKRPRVNKENSKLDRLQKQVGEYYYTRTRRERKD